MPVFRAYTVNAAGKITWGDWIEAHTVEDARRKAHQLCDSGHPTVELWEGTRKLADIACEDDGPPRPKKRPA
jgi:hypothetical protein